MPKLIWFALLLIFAFDPSAFAQVATGQYPLGTFDVLGPEVINVGNLNIMLSVPVVHKPGREGLALPRGDRANREAMLIC